MVNKKHIFKKQKGGISLSSSLISSLPKKQHGTHLLNYATQHQGEISKTAAKVGSTSLKFAGNHGNDISQFVNSHHSEISAIGGPGTSLALKAAETIAPKAYTFAESHQKEISNAADIAGSTSLNFAKIYQQHSQQNPVPYAQPFKQFQQNPSPSAPPFEQYQQNPLPYAQQFKQFQQNPSPSAPSAPSALPYEQFSQSISQNNGAQNIIQKINTLDISLKKKIQMINYELKLINEEITSRKKNLNSQQQILNKTQIGGEQNRKELKQKKINLLQKSDDIESSDKFLLKESELREKRAKLLQMKQETENNLDKLHKVQSKENLKKYLEDSMPEGGEELAKKSIGNMIKNFLKSDFFNFIVNYLFFIVLISICLYILLYINKNTNDNIIIIETKVFFYILLIFLFIVINDILSTSQEGLKKFVLIILFSLIVIYIGINLIQQYYGGEPFKNNLLKVFYGTLIIFAIVLIIMFFLFVYKKKDGSSHLFHNFNNAFKKNYKFLIFITIYILIYKYVSNISNLNSSLSDILCPVFLGLFVLIFIFSMIVYLGLKLKVIKQISVLNTFITLFAIVFFLGTVFIYIFMSSLTNICTGQPNQSNEDTLQQIEIKERLTLGIIVSLIIVLWLRDSRNWRQIGSIVFIITTIFVLAAMFYYSTVYPSLSVLSLWLFFEWILLIFKQKENSKNSVHFSFMNV